MQIVLLVRTPRFPVARSAGIVSLATSPTRLLLIIVILALLALMLVPWPPLAAPSVVQVRSLQALVLPLAVSATLGTSPPEPVMLPALRVPWENLRSLSAIRSARIAVLAPMWTSLEPPHPAASLALPVRLSLLRARRFASFVRPKRTATSMDYQCA